MEHFYKTIGEDWFNYKELYSAVIRHFPSGSHFVEVGSWKGRSAAFMAVEIINSGKDIKVSCVDLFEYYDGNTDLTADEFTGSNGMSLYEQFLNNVKPVSNIISAVKDFSDKAAAKFKDNSIDFCFIDAAHDYAHVKQDVEAWLPKIKKGGIIAGHDYESGNGSVGKAVKEIFGTSLQAFGPCWVHEKGRTYMSSAVEPADFLREDFPAYLMPSAATDKKQRNASGQVVFMSNSGILLENVITGFLAESSARNIPKQVAEAIPPYLLEAYRNGNSFTSPDALLFELYDNLDSFKTYCRNTRFENLDSLKEFLFWNLNDHIYKHVVLEWLDELGCDLSIYGRGWDKHPRFGKYFKGVIESPYEAAEISRSADFNLYLCSPEGDAPYQQKRLLECLARKDRLLIRGTPPLSGWNKYFSRLIRSDREIINVDFFSDKTSLRKILERNSETADSKITVNSGYDPLQDFGCDDQGSITQESKNALIREIFDKPYQSRHLITLPNNAVNGNSVGNKKIVALIFARNEAPILKNCLLAVSKFSDAVVLLDNNSDDDTLRIAESLKAECSIERIIQWKGFNEHVFRTKLLDAGREIGGTHFICIDADELFTANLMHSKRLRNKILTLQPGDRLKLTWIELWRTWRKFRCDSSVWSFYEKEIIFCDDGKSSYPEELIHLSCIPPGIQGQSHTISGYKYGLLHFQFICWESLLIKQAWYRCMERINTSTPPALINEKYALTKDECNIRCLDSLPEWFDGYEHLDVSAYGKSSLWRKQQVLEWFKRYGLEYFKELDIWDVDWSASR